MFVFCVKIDSDHNSKKLKAGDLLESQSALSDSFPDKFSLRGSQQEVAVQTDVPLVAKSASAAAALAPQRTNVSDDAAWAVAALDHGVTVFHVDAKMADGGGYYLMSGDTAINEAGLAKNQVRAAILATGA